MCVTYFALTNCYIFTNMHHTTLFIFEISISRRCWTESQLMQQAPEPSSWHSRGWRHPPLSSAFFCSAHNLRKPADCRWRALYRLSWSTQLSAGRHSTSNAHSLSLVSRFQMQHILGIIPHAAVRSPRGWETILTPPFFRTSLQTINTPFQYPR